MRLQHFLALAGVASRRQSEKLMLAGHVRVNGNTARELGTKVDPLSDVVELDGKRVQIEKKFYVLLNKPRGYLSSVGDARGRRTVSELVADIPARLYPVGRLDMDTDGVLLMTNDGELCHRLTHPRFEVEKTYHAEVEGTPSREAMEDLQRGVVIDGVRTSPARARILRSSEDRSLLEITVHEGRKRQVKRMCETVGHPVARLTRVRFGDIGLGSLEPGQHRLLSDAEVAGLL
ncbi:rRNA pseudouridine synthase [Candidatus Poribacteria bacterium]|nr:rRNA pseudouridine synthase [Candidatus Poribacteria bacterium]